MKIAKWIGISIGGLMMLLTIAGITLYFCVKPYLSSDSFRQLVEIEVSKQLQVEVKLEPLQWSGLSLFVNSIKTSGESKVALKSLDVQQFRISVALRPLLSRVARIDSIELQSLSVEFQVPEPQSTPEPQPTEKPAPAPPPSWIQSIAPQKIEIGEIIVNQAKVRWPSGENAFGELSQVKLNASVDGSDVNMQLTHGKLVTPQLPELNLQRLKGRLHQQTLFITNATLDYQNQGSCTVDGEIGLGTPVTTSLNFELSTIPITPFLPGDWKARLVGNLNGKFKLAQNESTQGIPQVTGNVELVQGKIEALPAFNELAKITQTEKWKSLPLDRAKASLNWNPNKTLIENIDFESKGWLIVQGTFQVEGQNITSPLTVGTNPDLIKHIPGIVDQVFNQPLGNYATTVVNISGTKDDLKEDLRERLIMAAANSLLEKIPGGVGDKIKEIGGGLLDLFKK